VANSYLLGICTGSFAAAAISTSQTVSELIPAGVEAVLVAFRTALRSAILRNDLEEPIHGMSRSWSVVVSLQQADADALINAFCMDKVGPVIKL
jgi:naphtho-gamma-pyrone polyketide synthase